MSCGEKYPAYESIWEISRIRNIRRSWMASDDSGGIVNAVRGGIYVFLSVEMGNLIFMYLVYRIRIYNRLFARRLDSVLLLRKD